MRKSRLAVLLVLVFSFFMSGLCMAEDWEGWKKDRLGKYQLSTGEEVYLPRQLMEYSDGKK
ncbi:MAG: hypothetical protein NTW04_05865, partial [Elusimicrobia bacterium]|nr:hypothetical protein [Elusimicrobiota bacterium]